MSTAADDKYASEFPLPGGVEQYFDTLVEVLRFIRENNVAPNELAKWIFQAFPNASGQVAVNGYIASLSRMGLWTLQDGVIRLSPQGAAIVNAEASAPDDARRMVMEIKLQNYLGYDALFTLLAEGAQSFDSIQEHLKQALAVDWKSKNQTSFRVNWLRSLGFAEKNGQGYQLTDAGRALFEQVGKRWTEVGATQKPSHDVAREAESSPLISQAKSIADWLDKTAIAGGDGKEFEQATEAAFKFLGFQTQLISGSGNPDVVATAPMGEKSYRILIDSKSRASGVVQQNDVNFHVLEKQKQNAGANYAAIVGANFTGGNLAEFAINSQVRLLTTSNLRELLLLHAECAFALDALQILFRAGGAMDDNLLPEIREAAESHSGLVLLVRKVFAAVCEYQGQPGVLNIDSLFYILKSEHSLPTLKLAVDFLRSDMIGALGETERGSLYARVSPMTLTSKLSQITRAIDLSHPAAT